MVSLVSLLCLILSYQTLASKLSLRQSIRKSTIHATASGAISTAKILKYETCRSANIQFVISVTEGPKSDYNKSLHTINQSNKKSTVQVDPFSPEAIRSNPDLLITHVDSGYSLVLNRFNTFPDHTILVTKSFEYQQSYLTKGDFRAWMKCILDIGAVGLFNSHLFAGASQKHKHMQLVPLDVIWEARMHAQQTDAEFQLPIEDIIIPYIESKAWSTFTYPSNEFTATSTMYHIPQYQFVHGVVALTNKQHWEYVHAGNGHTYDEYLVKAYEFLLTKLDITTKSSCSAEYTRALPAGYVPQLQDGYRICTAYNLLLTERWMMTVPRSMRDMILESSLQSSGGNPRTYPPAVVSELTSLTLSINAFAYLGLVLSRGWEIVEAIKNEPNGPITILEHVSKLPA